MSEFDPSFAVTDKLEMAKEEVDEATSLWQQPARR